MREKEQSNLPAPSPRRFTLPKKSILLGRSNYKRLFSDSESLSARSVFLRYRIEQSKTLEFKIAFIAPKKIGNAVNRNRIKRLMRETYRLNQSLTDSFAHTPILLHVAFIATSTEVNFKAIQKDIVTLLNKLRAHVAEHSLLNT